MENMLIFTSPPPKVYGLYICENVDIYGRPLKLFYFLNLLGSNQFIFFLKGVHCHWIQKNVFFITFASKVPNC